MAMLRGLPFFGVPSTSLPLPSSVQVRRMRALRDSTSTSPHLSASVSPMRAPVYAGQQLHLLDGKEHHVVIGLRDARHGDLFNGVLSDPAVLQSEFHDTAHDDLDDVADAAWTQWLRFAIVLQFGGIPAFGELRDPLLQFVSLDFPQCAIAPLGVDINAQFAAVSAQSALFDIHLAVRPFGGNVPEDA